MNNLFTNPIILSIGMLISSLIVIWSSISSRGDAQIILAGVQRFDERIEQARRADSDQIQMLFTDFEEWKKDIVEYESARSMKQMLMFGGSMGMLFFGFGIFYTNLHKRKKKAEPSDAENGWKPSGDERTP